MNRTTISSKKINFITSLVMAVVILALSPISVLAYSPAPAYQIQGEQTGLSEGTIYAYPDQNNFPEEFEPFQKYGTEHDIFVANDGQVYILNDSDSPVERLLCFHDWQDGKLYNHVPNNDGSCVVYCYDCQCCSKCGSAKNVTYTKTISYAKCPH